MLHKRILAALLSTLLLITLTACNDIDRSALSKPYEASETENDTSSITFTSSHSPGNDNENNVQSELVMNIQVGDYLLTAALIDNSTTQALIELLSEGPIIIEMKDYGNIEKVGSLPESLPRNDEAINTEPGDLILYQGNSFVIYYDTNSWELTRIGKINDITQQELKEILGSGDVTVILSLNDTD